MIENKILVDIHEDQKIIKLLQENNIPHEVKHLPIGDYWISDKLIIERKSINDMVSSSYGHLQEQIKNMILNEEHFKKIVVAIVGAYDDLFWMHFKVNENSYFGMLASLSTNYDSKVEQIHFKRPLQFVKYLKFCLNNINENNVVDFTKIKRLDFKDNTELSLLCALPSISQMKAQKILEKFKVKMVLCDKEKGDKLEAEFIKNELMKIDGIGKGIYKKMSEYLY